MPRALLTLIIAYGCVLPNRDPNILGQPPYNEVTYESSPSPVRRRIDVVTVTRRGVEAGILSTIPALYRRALECGRGAGIPPGQPVYISNISLYSFTKREMVSVSYQDCRTVYELRSVTEQKCESQYNYATKSSTYRCQPVSRMQSVPVQKCETKYRIEPRDVLYQTATGDVHG